MENVFLHTRNPRKMDWENSSRQFLRLPVVGEYLSTSSNAELYKVQFVEHCPFHSQYAAEVYAVKVDRLAAMAEAFVG